MARAQRDEDLMAALRAHRDDPATEAAAEAIERALAGGASHVVAAAAELCAEAELERHAPALPVAYARFEKRPIETDPGCKAKTAIVAALARFAHDPHDVFARAVRCQQLEPVRGGRVDTAASLRGHAAVGLARTAHPAAAVDIAHLLADHEWMARAGAAQALGFMPVATSVPLLRYKVLAGDAEARVLGECFSSLLAVEPAGSLDFVVGWLDGGDDEIAEQAALALGEARSPEAFERLRAHDAGARGPRRRVSLLAIAVVRSDAARDYLIGQLARADRQTAAYALEALAIYRHDPRAHERILSTALARKDHAALAPALARFQGDER